MQFFPIRIPCCIGIDRINRLIGAKANMGDKGTDLIFGAIIADTMPEIVCNMHDQMQKIRRQASAAGVHKEGGGNVKFMGDSEDIKKNTFEAKFGGEDVFHGGLDKVIGLPDPNVFQAIINEHENHASSRKNFKTNNYDLETNPHQELEAVLNPKRGKQYPGAGQEDHDRRIVPIRTMLSVSCPQAHVWRQH